MIQSKKELKFYILADMMMNRGKFKWSLLDRIKFLLCPDYIMKYLKHLRYCDYYSGIQNQSSTARITQLARPQVSEKLFMKIYIRCKMLLNKYHNHCILPIKLSYHKLLFRKLGIKLGFSIGYSTLGYGTVIPHYGTIVVGKSNRLGNYVVLHTSTCISDNGKIIGDALYVATGVKITSKINIGDNVSIGANSLVNKSFGSNILIGGVPAKEIKEMDVWYVRDGCEFSEKVNKVEALKKELGL